ncbi:MAG: XisI protein [Chloroflexi bacterium]|nr:XisI protein [Chloroflexota bacterium]
MQVGWDRGACVRGNLIYVTLQGREVVIEYDGIEYGIADDLVRLGIPRQQIVLAFLPQPKQTQSNGLKAHLSPETA